MTLTYLVVRAVGFLEDLQRLLIGLSSYATKLRAHNSAIGAVVVDVGGRQAGSRLTWAVPLLNVTVLQKPKPSVVSALTNSLPVATAEWEISISESVGAAL